MPKPQYNFEIFNARGVRTEQLNGTPYRYWHSHAIADIFARRLSGTVDVLDAGGRDGGTVNLLKNLGLRGTYTCLDRQPAVRPPGDRTLRLKSSPVRLTSFARSVDSMPSSFKGGWNVYAITARSPGCAVV